MEKKTGKNSKSKYLINAIFILIHLTGMTQLTFTQAIKELYFNVNINNPLADSIINDFLKVNQLIQQKK